MNRSVIDHLLRDLQVLRKANLLIGKIWLNVVLTGVGGGRIVNATGGWSRSKFRNGCRQYEQRDYSGAAAWGRAVLESGWSTTGAA
jgi:hypothetical protein